MLELDGHAVRALPAGSDAESDEEEV
jgi:hypothetical protein